MDNRPIGVFDSGLGGLTVLKELMNGLPSESIVYFGDCGRAPYGIKSKETVTKFVFQDIKFLLNQDIKLVIIACNTASAFSLESVINAFEGIPIIEVIQPGSICAINETKNKKIGVIGTTATISSGVYEKAISKLDKNIEIYSKDCPLFVPLAEEGWWDNEISYLTAKEYLSDLIKFDVDTLVLGCTHYPLLYETIQKVMGSEVSLVSSALEVAKVVKKLIDQNGIERDSKITPVYRYYTSDSVEKFIKLGESILGRSIYSVQKVDIERY